MMCDNANDPADGRRGRGGDMDCYLGLDLGTSGLKALVVDEAQQVLAQATAPLSIDWPRPGMAEQDPAAWWTALLQVMDRLAHDHPDLMRRVGAIGLSGQMHAGLLLDAADRPVHPAILWNDGRAFREAAELNALGEDLQAEVGVPAMPGFTAPKLMWLRRHRPEVLEQTRRLLLPKDYLRLLLTGEVATDASDAAGTWLFDQAARTWSARAVAAAGVDAAWLPPVLEATAPAGLLRHELASRFGMGQRVLVAAGGGDTPTGGVGIGACVPGRAFVSLGTSAQVFLSADAHRPVPAAYVHAFAHAYPDAWCQMAALLNGASVLGFAARLTGADDIAALLTRVEAGYARPSPLLFLPYLAGERTPHNDPDARGVIFGLAADTGPEELVQAAMEGVAYSLADGLAALTQAAPRPELAGFIGGGARSGLWARITASVLDLPLCLFAGGETGPAFGAARLAMLAAGCSPAEVIKEPPVKAVVEPDRALADAYKERLQAFRALYAALRPAFSTAPWAAGSSPAAEPKS